MPNVTGFGLDYSARELSPGEIDAYNAANPNEPISFLIRYIGYPTNPKCISHYPGALAAHEANGTLVLLVHQIGYLDFHGGYESGRQHALTALADADREGYPDDRPIFFAFDRFLAGDPNRNIQPLPLAKVWEYLAGAQSVLGGDRVGLYGFFDVIHPAIRESRVRWTWLCGAESNVINGLDLYQWNNGRRYPGTPPLETDLNKAYRDLSTFQGGDELSWNTRFKTPDGKAEFEAWQFLVWSNHYDNLIPAVVEMLNAHGHVLAEIAADDSNNIRLDPEQLVQLRTGVSADMSKGLAEMEAHLAEQLGLSKDVVRDAMRDFFLPAVQPDTDRVASEEHA